MTTAEFGVVGLAVMGRNLALNVASRGYKVALYNRTSGRTDDLVRSILIQDLYLAIQLKNLWHR